MQLADEAGKKYIFKRINREAFAFLSKGGAGEIKALTLATIDNLPAPRQQHGRQASRVPARRLSERADDP